MGPRQYISWSSLDTWERSPEKWKEIYIHGNKQFVNSGMIFGGMVATALEKKETTGDMVLDVLLEQVPKLDIMDKVIESPKGVEVEYYHDEKPKKFKVPVFSNGRVDIPILAKPDTMSRDMAAFKEYKTGQTKWTQGKVDEFGQITFYALAIYLINGKIPSDIELVYIPTEKQANDSVAVKIGATGDIRRFPTERSMTDILRMMVRIRRAWDGMIAAWDEVLY